MPSSKSIRSRINTALRRTKNRARDAMSMIIPGIRPGSIDFEAEKEAKIATLMEKNIEQLVSPQKGGKKSKKSTQKRRKHHRKTHKK